jgi:glucosylceramidase
MGEDAAPTVRQESSPTPPAKVARRLFLFGGLAAIGAATVTLWGDGDLWTSEDDRPSGGGDPEAPSEPEFDPEATYAIEYAGTGMVLDVTDVSYENGAIIQQWYDFGTDNQRWRFESVESAYLRIVSVSSGKSLGVVGASLDDGALIQQWDFSGGYEQQWTVTLLDDGTYSIVNRLSGKALDVPYGSADNGVQIQQWDYHGGANQRWNVTPD